MMPFGVKYWYYLGTDGKRYIYKYEKFDPFTQTYEFKGITHNGYIRRFKQHLVTSDFGPFLKLIPTPPLSASIPQGVA